MMRRILLFTALALAAPLAAQNGPVSAADSSLIYRILTAEDRRDVNDSALVLGTAHPDARIAMLARRALARIGDSAYAERTRGPQYAARVTWPLPEWWDRIGPLAAHGSDCDLMLAALGDSAWQVRFRAMDAMIGHCKETQGIVETLIAVIERSPLEGRGHRPGIPSWQPAAHAIRALARLRPDESLPYIGELAKSPTWGLRLYVARAAGLAGDTLTLRALTTDRDDNVKEAAIGALVPITHHADDALYRRALNASGAQTVRAAANALKGSTDPESARALDRALRRWFRRPNDSERDARLALLAAAGRPTTDDRRWNAPLPLPAEVVPLALGADVRLRVTLDSASGGGSFVVKLRGDVAPITAARVLALVRRRYYDGLLWQRVVPDFVIQGGGPGANEYVGYTHFFRDETGTVSHLRGGVGMSTRGHDTGDGQWFIDLGDEQRLDKDYTLFAEVVEGMGVVDQVMEGDRIATIAVVP